MAYTDAAAMTAWKGKKDVQLFSTLLKEMGWYNVYGKRTVRNILDFTRLKITDGLGPKTSTFKGGSSDQKFSGTRLTVSLWDRDFEIDPAEYFDMWMTEFQNDKNKPPFEAYIYQQYKLALQHEFSASAAYWGLGKDAYPAYNAAIAYTQNSDTAGIMKLANAATGVMEYWKCIITTTAGQTPTTHPLRWQKDNARAAVVGMGKVLADLIAASGSEISPYITGILDETNAYSGALGLYRSMPEQFKKVPMELQIGTGMAENICDELSSKYESTIKTLDDLPSVLPKTGNKLSIKIMDNMDDSNRMIITLPNENTLVGMSNISDMSSIKFVDTPKTLQGTFWGTMGFGIRDPKALFCNDAK